jgi:hypothetical protein
MYYEHGTIITSEELDPTSKEIKLQYAIHECVFIYICKYSSDDDLYFIGTCGDFKK